MKTFRSVFLPVHAGLALILSVECMPSHAGDACKDQWTRFRADLDREYLDEAGDDLDALESQACEPARLQDAREQFAVALAAKSQRQRRDGQSYEAERTLELTRAEHWRVSEARADIAAGEKRWQEAADQYVRAFELLRRHAGPADSGRLDDLKQKALDAQLLHGKLDRIATRGDGAPNILQTVVTRGPQAEQVPLPVHFDTGESTLNADGKESAAAILEFLRARADIGAVNVAGHADPRGSDRDNLLLSRRRAETIKAYLLEQGFRGAVTTAGFGEMRPPRISDPASKTEAERWALHRRVEFTFKSGK